MSLPEPTELVRVEGESVTDIEDILEGKVFHVTLLSNWNLIRTSGSILPNPAGLLPTTFGSSNSFFRARGCVSVFDYRAKPPEGPIDYRHRCHPLQPAQPDTPGVAILILHPDIYPKLLSWELCRNEVMCREQVVPYVEAGHPGPIPASLIEQLIFFRRIEAPDSLPAMLRRARSRAPSSRKPQINRKPT